MIKAEGLQFHAFERTYYATVIHTISMLACIVLGCTLMFSEIGDNEVATTTHVTLAVFDGSEWRLRFMSAHGDS